MSTGAAWALVIFSRERPLIPRWCRGRVCDCFLIERVKVPSLPCREDIEGLVIETVRVFVELSKTMSMLRGV